MCNKACIEFGRRYLTEEDVRRKSIIEVGALNVNGSLRPFAEAFAPHSYTGIDMQAGAGVDLVCDANDLLGRFGVGMFDVLISTELLEHVRDWRRVISNFKQVLKPGGVLLLTTRSKGFPFHDFPFDFWRFEISDMRFLFSDFIIEAIEPDPLIPGVFVRARKPQAFSERDLSDYSLYSVITDRRSATVTDADIRWFKVRYTVPYVLRRTALALYQVIVKAIRKSDEIRSG